MEGWSQVMLGLKTIVPLAYTKIKCLTRFSKSMKPNPAGSPGEGLTSYLIHLQPAASLAARELFARFIQDCNLKVASFPHASAARQEPTRSQLKLDLIPAKDVSPLSVKLSSQPLSSPRPCLNNGLLPRNGS
jgi:hypothetical protein